MTGLTADETERYARHLVLRKVGGPGQARIKAARVLVIGAGGLGAPLVHYLAAAGVGTLGVVDDDTVSLSNLQRQVLYRSDELGLPKAELAAARAGALNPHVDIQIHAVRLTDDNADAIVSGYDIVADGSDNFATRYAVADACSRQAKVLVTGALSAFDASITTIRAHETTDGRPNPTYRCLFPRPPQDGTVPSCAEGGVLGPLAGVAGSLMALEVVREVVGFGEGLVGKLLLIDAMTLRFRTIRYARSPGGSAAP